MIASKPTKKTREGRADLKEFKRGKKPRVATKTTMLNMIEVLIANGRAKHGICRHNHDITVLNSGKILVDDVPHGYIDASYTKAAKYLLSKGYYIEYVRSSPVIHTQDGEAVGITVGDIERSRR